MREANRVKKGLKGVRSWRALQLEKDAVNLLLNKKIDPNVASLLRLVLDNSRKMMEYSRDIAEVTLNRTIEETSTT